MYTDNQNLVYPKVNYIRACLLPVFSWLYRRTLLEVVNYPSTINEYGLPLLLSHVGDETRQGYSYSIQYKPASSITPIRKEGRTGSLTWLT